MINTPQPLSIFISIINLFAISFSCLTFYYPFDPDFLLHRVDQIQCCKPVFINPRHAPPSCVDPMSSNSASEHAAQVALHKYTVELWLLYAIGVSLTILRTYTRANAGGIGNLRAEDFLVWVGIVRTPPLEDTCMMRVAHNVANI